MDSAPGSDFSKILLKMFFFSKVLTFFRYFSLWQNFAKWLSRSKFCQLGSGSYFGLKTCSLQFFLINFKNFKVKSPPSSVFMIFVNFWVQSLQTKGCTVVLIRKGSLRIRIRNTKSSYLCNKAFTIFINKIGLWIRIHVFFWFWIPTNYRYIDPTVLQ